VATSPYQLWVDLPAVTSAVRVGSTVTISTISPHSIQPGSYIALEGITSTAGTSMNGAWLVATVPSGTTITFASSGTAGTGVVVATLGSGTASQTSYSAALSIDLFNPLINYTAANRQSALYVPTDSVQMSASGDGNGSTMGFNVMQDVTPSAGPWFRLIPDEARVRLIQKDTGTSPATDGSDVLFLGTINSTSSKLNDSGQGTESSIEVFDVNALLDRLVVFGKPVSSKALVPGNMVRASNVVTVTTRAEHGYAVGQKIIVTGAMGGGGTSFNGSFAISGVPDDFTFTYAQTGAGATAQDTLGPTGIQRSDSRSTNVIRVTFSVNHGIVAGQTIWIDGATVGGSSSGALANLVNNKFTGTQVKIFDSTRLLLTLSTSDVKKIPGGWASISAAGAIVYGGQTGAITITPDGTPQQGSIGVDAGASETSAVQKMLGVIAANKARDFPLNRLLKTKTTTAIVGSSRPNSIGLTFPAGTLRSALESIVEAYGGIDLKDRRFFVDASGKLNYLLTDSSALPTYATAPYKVITSGTQNPNTTSSAATIFPYDLKVDWDFRTTKEALVMTSSSETTSTSQRVVSYASSGYSVRPLAPNFDDVVEAPVTTKDPNAEIDRIARAFFLERHKPILTGSFSIRGAGTAAFNQYGFSNGYAQTGTATFALVQGWKPGQWVDISCSSLSLTGLYRIEQVDWQLEPGSFTSSINITFNRRPANTLTRLLNSIGA
jgi:hypothetical protein